VVHESCGCLWVVNANLLLRAYALNKGFIKLKNGADVAYYVGVQMVLKVLE